MCTRVRDPRWLAPLFGLYDLAWHVIAWTVLVPRELWLAYRDRNGLRDLRQRLGVAHLQRAPLQCIVVHAASIGEIVAAKALCERLRHEFAHCSILLTSNTREGRAAARRPTRGHTGADACILLPWDRSGAVRRWLLAIAPAAVVTVEAEIWPNLYRACRDLGVPLCLVNGRLDRRVVWQYELARPFFRRVLAWPDWIAARSEADRAAFVRAGAPAPLVEVVGDLKLAAAADQDAQLPAAWRDVVTAVAPLVVAGSTHAPEEQLLAACLRSLRTTFPGLRFAIAPRRPRRCRRVERICTRAGLKVARWSDGAGATAGWDVLVIDVVGVLATVYRYADVVVGGGTFVSVGGHNILEAVAVGRPIVVGPHVRNIEAVVSELAERTAIRRVAADIAGPEGLCSALHALLATPAVGTAMASRATRWWKARPDTAAGYARGVRRAVESHSSRSRPPHHAASPARLLR